ncbi:MAG: HD domain-containing protein [Chloroflexi bacterium]|nr:HD domain-containing protein [Chloroflexota bacterium]
MSDAHLPEAPLAWLQFLMTANRLKLLQRQGWAMRGVPQPENVAAHSHGMALVALALAESCGQALDREKVLTMALLHDLAEATLTDIPEPAVRLLESGAKQRAEEQAMDQLLGGLPGGQRLRSLWQEFEEASSPEGRLVRDADRLELMLQAYAYEKAGQRSLDEFWETMAANHWNYPISETLFAGLCAWREQLGLPVGPKTG